MRAYCGKILALFLTSYVHASIYFTSVTLSPITGLVVHRAFDFPHMWRIIDVSYHNHFVLVISYHNEFHFRTISILYHYCFVPLFFRTIVISNHRPFKKFVRTIASLYHINMIFYVSYCRSVWQCNFYMCQVQINNFLK